MTKGLTLTQPWATLIAEGSKQVETRGWSTRHRGPILIHAAKGWNRQAMRFALELYTAGILRTRPSRLPRGEIVAKAVLHHVAPTVVMAAAEVSKVEANAISDLERELGDYSPFRFAWVLVDVEPIAPVPWRGSLGLWNGPDL